MAARGGRRTGPLAALLTAGALLLAINTNSAPAPMRDMIVDTEAVQACRILFAPRPEGDRPIADQLIEIYSAEILTPEQYLALLEIRRHLSTAQRFVSGEMRTRLGSLTSPVRGLINEFEGGGGEAPPDLPQAREDVTQLIELCAAAGYR